MDLVKLTECIRLAEPLIPVIDFEDFDVDEDGDLIIVFSIQSVHEHLIQELDIDTIEELLSDALEMSLSFEFITINKLH